MGKKWLEGAGSWVHASPDRATVCLGDKAASLSSLSPSLIVPKCLLGKKVVGRDNLPGPSSILGDWRSAWVLYHAVSLSSLCLSLPLRRSAGIWRKEESGAGPGALLAKAYLSQ